MLIPIQSFSDLITNSSSEVFCTIAADKNIIKQIDSILSTVIPSSYDDDEEYKPVIKVYTKEKLREEGWESEAVLKSYPDQWIEISMPYCMSEAAEFYKAGIKALLDSKNIKDYTIKYE